MAAAVAAAAAVDDVVTTCAPAVRIVVTNLEFWQTYVAKSNYEIVTQLRDTHGWRVEPATRLAAILDETPRATLLFIPDAQGKHTRAEMLSAHERIRRHEGPRGVVIDDWHYWRTENEAMMTMCGTVLATVPEHVIANYPRVAKQCRIVDFPHCAASAFASVPFNASPEPRVLLASAPYRFFYPVRSMMIDACKRHGLPGVQHRHPGYERVDGEDACGAGYARRIGQYLCATTCGSRFEMLVRKHFEIPATGALLIAHSGTRARLRRYDIVPGDHYLSFTNELEFVECVRFALDRRNRDAVDRMRTRCREAVCAAHLAVHRAQQVHSLFLREADESDAAARGGDSSSSSSSSSAAATDV